MFDAFELEKGVEEPNSLNNRAFSIILHKTSMFSLCLTYMKAMAAAMAEVTALKIECYIVGSIARRAVIALKRETATRNLSLSVS